MTKMFSRSPLAETFSGACINMHLDDKLVKHCPPLPLAQ